MLYIITYTYIVQNWALIGYHWLQDVYNTGAIELNRIVTGNVIYLPY